MRALPEIGHDHVPVETRFGTRQFAAYEQLLHQDLDFAMTEGSYFLEGRGAVHETLRRLTQRLDELGIPYAVAGGMALFAHGYHRFTDDIDVLVTREGLKQVHQSLDGLGYVRPFEKSKNLRDATTKVKIEFLLTGEYPGDGKPKPVAFPDPKDAAETINGIRVLNLPKLIELKLASGMTAVGRSKDIADVEELIKLLRLPREFSSGLSPFVQPKFLEIWDQLHKVAKRYELLWRNKWLTSEAQSIDDMIAKLREAANELEAMKQDGVVLNPEGGTFDDYASLITTDEKVAEKYGMQPEDEFFDDEDDGAGARGAQ
jgi:hypothetical protein